MAWMYPNSSAVQQLQFVTVEMDDNGDYVPHVCDNPQDVEIVYPGTKGSARRNAAGNRIGQRYVYIHAADYISKVLANGDSLGRALNGLKSQYGCLIWADSVQRYVPLYDPRAQRQ